MVKRVLSVGLCTLAAASLLVLRSTAQKSASGEWRYSSGDNASTKYSPLDQINKDSVSRLHVAWRRPALSAEFQTANPQVRLINNYRATPIAGSARRGDDGDVDD